ncbi:hypothetical protein AMATHDRAFT_190166 [Amanita thiersii Skay4041]|uniref:Uncharacterized protein n=1 Tax=Amanita thiersii Skay4041 TaxID=703135 RepID=A0A2A9NS70_9AGAR|nr:hypothetical protein AMATHDRAFT_190166 [Amanita thiersii Skay4041]
MSNGSPTAYLLWAILSIIFLIFLLIHLWSYDKFNCLKWNAGRQPGAFRRLMTYSYLGTVPLLVVFSVAMSIMKFREGYVVMHDEYVIPRPLSMWSAKDRSWLLPLYFCLSFAWAFEIITHLEELTFWFFLINQGPSQRQWFYSWEFRLWYLGSMLAIIGLPLTTLITRHQIDTSQAYIFLVGSSASTTTTLCFFYVLLRFPSFIHHVKIEGAQPDVVVRLATFYQLNRIRVVFRFLFTIPLFIIAIDGLNRPYPIIGDPFALDFLLMLGGIGCFVSSAITLFIFFPRSIAQESGYRVQENTPQTSSVTHSELVPSPSQLRRYHQEYPSSPKSGLEGFYHHDSVVYTRTYQSPSSAQAPLPEPLQRYTSWSRESVDESVSPAYKSDAESVDASSQPQKSCPMSKTQSMPSRTLSNPNSDPRTDDTMCDKSKKVVRSISDGENLRERYRKATTSATVVPTGAFAERERRLSSLHPYLINFTSPIDILDEAKRFYTISRRSILPP